MNLAIRKQRNALEFWRIKDFDIRPNWANRFLITEPDHRFYNEGIKMLIPNGCNNDSERFYVETGDVIVLDENNNCVPYEDYDFEDLFEILEEED